MRKELVLIGLCVGLAGCNSRDPNEPPTFAEEQALCQKQNSENHINSYCGDPAQLASLSTQELQYEFEQVSGESKQFPSNMTKAKLRDLPRELHRRGICFSEPAFAPDDFGK